MEAYTAAEVQSIQATGTDQDDRYIIDPGVVDGVSGITIQSMDESAHTVSVRAEGSETRGRGGASATMTAQLQPSEKGTSVVMNTDLAVSGVVAQFGRTGIMQEVAQRMAQRFASCVDQELKTAAPAG